MIVPLIFFGVLAVSVGLALLSRVGHATSGIGDFLVGGRSFPSWLIYFLAVGEIYSIGTMIGLPAGLYAKGASYGVWFLGYILLAYPIGYFVAPLVWRAGKRYNAMTVPDVFGKHFGSRTLEVMTCLVLLAALIPWGQYQFIGLQVVLTSLGMSLSKVQAVILAAVIAFLYVSVSGVRSPAMISILKDSIMLVAIMVVGILAVHADGGIHPMFDPSVVPHSAVTMHGSALIFALTTIVFQSITFYLAMGAAYVFPAKSERAMKSSTIWMPLYMLMYPFLVLATYFAVAHKPDVANPNTIFMVTSRALLPDWLLGVVAAAAGLSGILVLAVTALALGGVVTRNIVPNVPASRQRRITTLVIAAFLAVAAGITLSGSTLMLTVLALTYVMFAQVVPGWVGILFFRGLRPLPTALGMVVGVLLGIYFYNADLGLGGINSGLICLAANALVAVVGSKMSRQPAIPSMRDADRLVPRPEREDEDTTLTPAASTPQEDA